MVEQATRDRVDAFWSSTMDTSVAQLHAPGVQVRVNPRDRETWRGIYVLGFEGAIVYTPADRRDDIEAAVAGMDAQTLLESATWQQILGAAAFAVFGPAEHYYLDDASGLAEFAEGRRLNPTDFEALGRLRSAVTQPEWVVTGFTAPGAILFGLFKDDALVAAANLTHGPTIPRTTSADLSPSGATDVGLLIHPQARGNGYGIRIAALAAKQAIAMHGLARFRVLTTSPSTVAIAEKLGCRPYGRNLVAYLSDAAPGA
jgi:hypothetical protein